MKCLELFPIVGQKVELTTNKGETFKAKLLWVYPSWCAAHESLKLDSGKTFFLTDVASVKVTD